MMGWKGFANQIELTYWVNSNLEHINGVVSIVQLNRTVVLFYNKEYLKKK